MAYNSKVTQASFEAGASLCAAGFSMTIVAPILKCSNPTAYRIFSDGKLPKHLDSPGNRRLLNEAAKKRAAMKAGLKKFRAPKNIDEGYEEQCQELEQAFASDREPVLC